MFAISLQINHSVIKEETKKQNPWNQCQLRPDIQTFLALFEIDELLMH